MIVIGDIHGQIRTLEALVSQLPKGRELCAVGDVIDRGADAKACVEFISQHHCVLGNHEDMALKAIVDEDERFLDCWLANGGVQTIEQFSTNGVADYDFFVGWASQLPLYHNYIAEDGTDWIISHSSAYNYFTTGDTWDILWTRSGNPHPIKGRRNIFGHTPAPRARISEHWVCIDTCSFCADGDLTAYDLETGEIWTQPNIDTTLYRS